MSRLRLENVAPGWLVVHVLGAAFIVITLLTAQERQAWVWACFLAGAACWVIFLAADRRTPRVATVALGLASLLPALTFGQPGNSSGVILCAISLGRFASLLTPSARTIVLIGGIDIAIGICASALAGAQPVGVLGSVAVLAVVLLFGLNRRQYQVQARQAERLLEQTRLAQAEQARAAALDERTRIAREIHDVLAHSLGGLGVQLELADAQLAEKSDPDAALRTVRRCRSLAGEGLAEARDAVAALRADVPALPEALERLAAEHRDQHGTEVQTEIPPCGRALPPAIAVSLLYAAREALTNAARHAHGMPVTISLRETDAALRLRVRNDVANDHAPRAGFGLSGMRERLLLAGGTLEAGQVGPVWQVTAEVPV